MIDKRKTAGKSTEYFLAKKNNGSWIYHDWFTVSELVRLPEFKKINRNTVQSRLVSGNYNDLYKLMTDNIKNNLSGPAKRNVRQAAEMKQRKKFIDILALF